MLGSGRGQGGRIRPGDEDQQADAGLGPAAETRSTSAAARSSTTPPWCAPWATVTWRAGIDVAWDEPIDDGPRSHGAAR